MSLAKRWSKPALADASRRRIGSVSVSVFIVLVLAVTGVELTAATDEEGSADDGDDDELGVVRDADDDDEDCCAGGSELFMAMGTRRDDKGEALTSPIMYGGSAFRVIYFLTYNTCFFWVHASHIPSSSVQAEPLAK
jgi:hypothetical protein